MTLDAGDFVELRGRPWLVEANKEENSLTTIQLSCIADDAQGEPLEVLWDAEIGATLLDRTIGSRSGMVDRTARRFSLLTSG
jgi:hypothetical protein